MQQPQFETLIKQTFERTQATLFEKNVSYNNDVDVLGAFKRAAAIMGVTPEQALGGFMAKHIASIYDLLQKDSVDLSVWDEKIGDAMNYLALLSVLIRENKTSDDRTLCEPQVRSFGVTTN